MADDLSTRGTTITRHHGRDYGARGHSLVHRDNKFTSSPPPSALPVFEALGVHLDIVDSLGSSLAQLIEATDFTPAFRAQIRTLVRRLRHASNQSSLTYQMARQQRRSPQQHDSR